MIRSRGNVTPFRRLQGRPCEIFRSPMAVDAPRWHKWCQRCFSWIRLGQALEQFRRHA